MKNILLAALLLTATVQSIQAQKFDREVFNFQNTHLPSRLIYDQIKTYGINVTVNSSNFFTIDNTFATGLVTELTSYEKVDYSSADLKMNASFGAATPIEEKTISRVAEEEVNKVKTKVTYYKRQLNFRFAISYIVTNSKNSVVLFRNDFAASNIRTIESGEYKTELEAVNYLNTNKAQLLATHINSLSQQFMAGSNAVIRDQFDFFTNRTAMDIYQVKKWDRDEEYNAHVKNVKNVFNNATFDEQPEINKAKLKSDIEYFQSFDGVFKADDKKEDILFFLNNYNLATIFFCLDELDKADAYIKRLDSSKKQDGATRLLSGYIKSARTRMAKHFVSNTHLIYNPVKEYKLAGKSFVSDAASSTEQVAASMSTGAVEATDKVMLQDGKELTGKVVFVNEKVQMQLVTKEDPDNPTVLTPVNCKSFDYNGKNYVSAKNNSGGATVKQFFLILHSSERIKLLQYVNDYLIPDNNYVGFIRPAEDVITFGTGLGIKKKLAKYFEDCPAVSEKTKDGDFGGAFSKDLLGKFKTLCEEYDACK